MSIESLEGGSAVEGVNNAQAAAPRHGKTCVDPRGCLGTGSLPSRGLGYVVTSWDV